MENGNKEKEMNTSNGMQLQVPRPRVSLVPFQHTKVVHLIRHAEGFHNVAGKISTENYMSEEYHDAHLTRKGWAQVAMLHDHINRLPNFKADVVVVSPMTRTLETASGIFGNTDIIDDGPILMKSQTDKEGVRTEMSTISANGSPPFITTDLCREVSGLHPCDRRKSVGHYKQQFPTVDFSLVASEIDQLWTPTEREDLDSVRCRAKQFLEFLAKRPESHIAVVSHSGFLRNMCRMLGENLGSPAKEELHSYFENCEMRTVTLINEPGDSMNGGCPFSFKPPKTNT